MGSSTIIGGVNANRDDSRRKAVPHRANGKNRRGKDRGGTGKGDVQLRAAGLQHDQTGVAICLDAAKGTDYRGAGGAALRWLGISKPSEKVASGVAEAIRKILLAEQAEEEQASRLRSWPYKKRLNEFLRQFVLPCDAHVVGREHWYKNIRIGLTFRQVDTEDWFRPNEPKPCIMKGSIYALRTKWMEYTNARKSYWAEEVIERQFNWWLKKRKITALGSQEYFGIVRESFWYDRGRKLEERYGSGAKPVAERILYGVVTADPPHTPGMGGYVLIEGVRYDVDGERLAELRAMRDLGRRMR